MCKKVHLHLYWYPINWWRTKWLHKRLASVPRILEHSSPIIQELSPFKRLSKTISSLQQRHWICQPSLPPLRNLHKTKMPKFIQFSKERVLCKSLSVMSPKGSKFKVIVSGGYSSNWQAKQTILSVNLDLWNQSYEH